MIVILGAVIGAVWGALLAKKRGGGRADMAQYGAAFGIALAIAGMFVTILVERML